MKSTIRVIRKRKSLIGNYKPPYQNNKNCLSGGIGSGGANAHLKMIFWKKFVFLGGDLRYGPKIENRN